jgi:predicted nucleotidyltransferase
MAVGKKPLTPWPKIDYSQFNTWYRRDAIALCADIFKVLEPIHHFPALTGGTLYKDDSGRKDVDIVIYSSRQEKLNRRAVIKKLEEELGFENMGDRGWVTKMKTRANQSIDLFFPEVPKSSKRDAYD